MTVNRTLMEGTMGIVVAIDGPSGSGKSTVATMILFTYSTGGLVVVVFCVGWLGVMVLALVRMRAGSLWRRKAVGRGG